MDRVNHLWPEIAALTPHVGLVWCFTCSDVCAAVRVAYPRHKTQTKSWDYFENLSVKSLATLRCKALGRPRGSWGTKVVFEDIQFSEKRIRSCMLRWVIVNGCTGDETISVLHFAVSFGLTDALQTLKDWGLTLQDVRSNDNYALRLASERGNVNVLQFLKMWGSSSRSEPSLTLQDVRNSGALQEAAIKGHFEVLRFFKEWGLTLGASLPCESEAKPPGDMHGNNSDWPAYKWALHYAYINGRSEATQFLED